MTPDAQTRRLLRGAVRVHARLIEYHRRHRRSPPLEHLGGLIQNFSRRQRHLNACLGAGWSAALRDILIDLDYDLMTLESEAGRLRQFCREVRNSPPTLRPVFDELRQLDGEFDGLRVDPGTGALSVDTAPIHLEDTSLGRFRIHLELSGAEDSDVTAALRIEALEPNPARQDDSITHPHVKSGRLCAGEGLAAMNQALVEGRLCDLFILVRSVLETYNEDSPFIPLDNWDGRPCAECGDTVDTDEGTCCGSCEQDVCDRCTGACSGCDVYWCRSCLRCCPACEERFCSECLSACRECGENFCEKCLNEGICKTCQPEESNHEPIPETSAAQGGPANPQLVATPEAA